MDALTVRVLPHVCASGPHQMAADETMLHSAVDGIASFRTYTWSEPTASLGYFQSHRVLETDPKLASLPFVRRPSGGQTLVHHHELTYALALPKDVAGANPTQWLRRIHEVIGQMLRDFDIPAEVAAENGEKSEGFLCFHHITAGDLVIGGNKIAGSAQRRRHGALLQHGALLLSTSPRTADLPGVEQLAHSAFSIEEIGGIFSNVLTSDLHWTAVEREWNDNELETIQGLKNSKYTTQTWNEKR